MTQIKTIDVKVGGVTYNIIQFSGRKATELQLKLVGLAKDMTGLSALLSAESFGGSNEYAMFIRCIAAVPSNDVLDIIETLFTNIRCPLLEPEAKEMFPASQRVTMDNFSSENLMHMYELTFESLKANFGNFLTQLKQTSVFNTSVAQGQ